MLKRGHAQYEKTFSGTWKRGAVSHYTPLWDGKTAKDRLQTF